jgi:glycerophosphoryl diester phosphodiesterase
LDASLPALRSPRIAFAHRGARAHAPENTLEAFQLGLRLGANGLESDAWLTADRQVVLVHDGQVGSSFRKRPVSSLTRAQLPAHIPTLAELYATCGTGYELSLDLKDPATVQGVLDVARAAGGGAEERLWLCHHDWQLVSTWRSSSEAAKLVDSTRLKDMPLGPERRAAELSSAGIDAVNLRQTEWSGGLVALFHRFDRYALAWDAQHERVIRELLAVGIDGVYSDHVDRLTSAFQAVP